MLTLYRLSRILLGTRRSLCNRSYGLVLAPSPCFASPHIVRAFHDLQAYLQGLTAMSHAGGAVPFSCSHRCETVASAGFDFRFPTAAPRTLLQKDELTFYRSRLAARSQSSQMLPVWSSDTSPTNTRYAAGPKARLIWPISSLSFVIRVFLTLFLTTDLVSVQLRTPTSRR